MICPNNNNKKREKNIIHTKNLKSGDIRKKKICSETLKQPLWTVSKMIPLSTKFADSQMKKESFSL